MPRPRGRPSERDFYKPDKYKLGNFCRWCGKYRGLEIHMHLYCHAKQLNSLHGSAYWCLNPECSFFTTNDAISIKHAINSWNCCHFYSLRYRSVSRWAEREGMEQTLLDSKVILRPSTTSPNTWILPDNKKAHIRNVFLRKERGLPPCIPGAAASSSAQSSVSSSAPAPASSSAQSSVSSSAPAPAPANNMTVTGKGLSAAHKCTNEAADDDHPESGSISDNEANPGEEEDDDDDKRSDEGLESDRFIKAGFWRQDDYDFDSLNAPEENVQGKEAETVNSQAATTSAVVRVAICPIEGHNVDLKGVEGVMAHIINELYDVEKARASFGTLQGAHGMANPFVRALSERGIPMATMNFMLNVVKKEIQDWAKGELNQGTIAEESVRRLQKRLTCPSFSQERRSIREACQSYIGHVYELSFDVKEFQDNADPADSIFKVLLRDPIVLAHDIVSSSNVLARGEKLHLSAVDGPLLHFCHGTRYNTMITKVHNEVRRLKQGGEGEERALPWADVDPATVFVLPLAFFIGDTHVRKSGALTQCPIVMTVLWFDSHGFRRNNTKRIMGYIPSPPGLGSAPHKAAVLKRACRQAAQRAILDLVDAWQRAAFRKGGLLWRVADGRLVRAIPAPALFLGDNKEQNVLTGTMERTRCRMCSANVSTMLNGKAMPEGPMRDFFDLKQAYGRLRCEDRAACIAFQEKYGLQVDGPQGLFQTTVNLFAGKEVYRMFCFDTMHTLDLGPLKDILIATLSSVQTRNDKTRNFKTLKTLSKIVNGASSGLSQIQSDALADLQLYMHRAGDLPANALQRNRLESKYILPLARATLTAFLHDLAFEAAEEQILPVARDLRVLLWALAAAVRVTHELTRPALDPDALPAAKEEVRELSRLVQRFRLLGGFKEMTTLKTHALSHMVDQVAFTGGTAFCDTASFEHYHLLVAKAARLVNNTDTTGSQMLHRAIELDAARILTPADPPDECKRARTIGEQGDVPHCAGIDVAEAASITIKHIRNMQAQASNLDALEEGFRGKLEETFEGAPAVDGFVKGKMGSIDLRVVGAKPLRWRAKPPSLFLTRDKSFFAPLLFLRSVSVQGTAESSRSKFWVAGAVVGRDKDLHARLEKTTYASNPLSGFAVVDLGDSLRHLRPDQLQIKSIDDLAAGDTIWLKPPSDEEMHRKIVFWPAGSSAFPSWLSCPFTDQRGDQVASAGDVDDVNDEEDFATLAHARETSRRGKCTSPASSNHQARAQKMPRYPSAQQTSQVSQASFSKD